MLDKHAPSRSDVCGFRRVVLFDWSEINRAYARSGGSPMNSLFLAGLTLFFAQGLVGRESLPARMFVAVIVSSLAAAFVNSLGIW